MSSASWVLRPPDPLRGLRPGTPLGVKKILKLYYGYTQGHPICTIAFECISFRLFTYSVKAINPGVFSPLIRHRTHPRPLLYSWTYVNVVLLTYLLTYGQRPHYGTTEHRGIFSRYMPQRKIFEWLRRRTCDQQVAAFEYRMPRATLTHVPLSPSSVSRYQPMGRVMLGGWGRNRGLE